MDKSSVANLNWLMELLEQEGLAEIEVRQGDRQYLVRAAAAAAVPLAPGVCPPPAPAVDDAAADPPNTERLLSPMSGVFYRKPSPESPAYVDPGDVVEIGDTLGLIEAMKLYNEVTSHLYGRIVRFLADNEAHVEADQPLALIERLSHQ
jgi:acetyl-CoA carboxylase biotin carboxyl carrier protein